MPTTPSTAVRRRRIRLVIALATVVVLVLLSAFVWPHWAVKGQGPNAGATATAGQGQGQSAKPSPRIAAVPLPENSSELLKAMPDAVSDFARTKAEAATDWGTRVPVEEYTLVYSTGHDGEEVTLHLAQWTKAADAKQAYDAFAAGMTGKELASGRVKAEGGATGVYVEREVAGDAKTAQALWQNDTVVFQAQGPKAALEAFYKAFPL